MPEAEELITDAARHATIYARELWRRHRKDQPQDKALELRDVAQRLDLLISAVFGSGIPIRVAQAPAPPTLLTKVFKRGEGPRRELAIPATDGVRLWLPSRLPMPDRHHALDFYRVMALQQAMRARRGGPRILHTLTTELQGTLFSLLEAQAADEEIVRALPGLGASLDLLRATALDARPPLERFPPFRRPLEEFVRALLSDAYRMPDDLAPARLAQLAPSIETELLRASPETAHRTPSLYRDWWTGELLPFPPEAEPGSSENHADDTSAPGRPRSARMERRPDVREPGEDEDDEKQGAWMVQTSQPHEQVEDPVGMQRPTDRDERTAAEEFADALSELPEARLVSTPGRPKEVLLSDDAPEARAKKREFHAAGAEGNRLQYPEWDYRIGAYREPGATIHLLPPQEGPQEWVDATLEKYRAMLHLVQRRFEMLKAQRVRMRKQLEGDDIDLEAFIDSYTDYAAGLAMAQGLYQTYRTARRDMAIVLLIDISGSTDGWISGDRRVIDVEREALLLVSIALQGLQEPYAIMGFSGEGPQGVTIRPVKAFDEPYQSDVARRIAALEPEHYTRAGAALRHATASLMQHTARHRLLLLLSDGKPNDVDDYEGRYGVEDMRQAVTEARLQGIQPFCLTIDRQAANYLPAIFGAHHYALLPKPELLPAVLLEWMKRLVSA